jgi:hypothetical protein
MLRADGNILDEEANRMALRDWKREPKIIEHNASFSRWHRDEGNKLFSLVAWKKAKVYETHLSVWRKPKSGLGWYKAGQIKKFSTYAKALAHAKSFLRRN